MRTTAGELAQVHHQAVGSHLPSSASFWLVLKFVFHPRLPSPAPSDSSLPVQHLQTPHITKMKHSLECLISDILGPLSLFYLVFFSFLGLVAFIKRQCGWMGLDWGGKTAQSVESAGCPPTGPEFGFQLTHGSHVKACRRPSPDHLIFLIKKKTILKGMRPIPS